MAGPDGGAGGNPGAKRSPVVLILAVLGACALLAIAGLVALALLARRQLLTVQAHFEAAHQASAAPGQPVLDPMLPTGSLDVDLVAAAPELRLEQSATLQLGAQSAPWMPSSPVHFVGVGVTRAPISVTGPYIVEATSFQAPAGSRGAQLAVRAIPIDLALPYDSNTGYTPQKVLEVDLTLPDALDLRWKQGTTVLAIDAVPRSPEALGGLAAIFETQWEAQRGHFEPADNKLDQAILRVARTTPFAEILTVVDALLAVKRPMRGSAEAVAAFHVSVQPLLRPRPHPEPCPLEDAAPAWKGPSPRLRTLQAQSSGRLPPAVIARVVATAEAALRRCYLDGLRREPKLQGRVSVRFVIGRDGAVSHVQASSPDLGDALVLESVEHAFEELSFPQPEKGIVTVTYPFQLSTKR